MWVHGGPYGVGFGAPFSIIGRLVKDEIQRSHENAEVCLVYGEPPRREPPRQVASEIFPARVPYVGG